MDGSLQSYGLRIVIEVDAESVEVVVVDDFAVDKASARALIDGREYLLPSKQFRLSSEFVVLDICDRFAIIVTAQRKQCAVEEDQS